MFIRQTQTRQTPKGDAYTTFRLVVSERVGKQVRQRTLLNLGRQFDLPQSDWPVLCTRIEQILAGQSNFLPVSTGIEQHALFITVLAYQLVQVIRARLREHDVHHGWARLREIFSVQQRVTVTFRQRDGRTLHVRKATLPDTELRTIQDMLNLPCNPEGVKKQII